MRVRSNKCDSAEQFRAGEELQFGAGQPFPLPFHGIFDSAHPIELV